MHQKQMDQQINSSRLRYLLLQKNQQIQNVSPSSIKLMERRGQVDRSGVDRSTDCRFDQQKLDLCQMQQQQTRQQHRDQGADYGPQVD